MTFIFVNGSPSDEFFMGYGLRHGILYLRSYFSLQFKV